MLAWENIGSARIDIDQTFASGACTTSAFSKSAEIASWNLYIEFIVQRIVSNLFKLCMEIHTWKLIYLCKSNTRKYRFWRTAFAWCMHVSIAFAYMRRMVKCMRANCEGGKPMQSGGWRIHSFACTYCICSKTATTEAKFIPMSVRFGRSCTHTQNTKKNVFESIELKPLRILDLANVIKLSQVEAIILFYVCACKTCQNFDIHFSIVDGMRSRHYEW